MNPTDSGDLMGGTQDNGTWSNDPDWFETINGDGGHSGYDAGNADIRFHTYYDAYVDVNFRGNDPVGWNWIGDPMYYSKEQRSFYVSALSDPVRPGYMYIGMEHVWRTTDNGGDQAYLEEHCNEFTGDFAQIRGCGDWKKVGGGPSNGNLTAAVWGDRAGQFISVIERGADRNTLWAGTRTGRVFISKNIATNGSVKFSRLDTPTHAGPLRERHRRRPGEREPRLGRVLGVRGVHPRPARPHLLGDVQPEPPARPRGRSSTTTSATSRCWRSAYDG